MFGTQAFFKREQIVAVEGNHKTYRRQADSGTGVVHEFCPECGSALLWQRLGSETLDLAVAAFASAPQNVSYCASKAWMNRFTEGLSIELGAWKSPVTVQALCPGYTLSEFHDLTGADRSAIPMGFWCTPDGVVDESLRAFEQRKLFVIPNWRYQLLMGFVRAIPSAWVRWGSVYFVKLYRKNKHGA